MYSGLGDIVKENLEVFRHIQRDESMVFKTNSHRRGQQGCTALKAVGSLHTCPMGKWSVYKGRDSTVGLDHMTRLRSGQKNVSHEMVCAFCSKLYNAQTAS